MERVLLLDRARDRERERRSPCLSRREREESRDLADDPDRDFRDDLEVEVSEEQHLMRRMKKMREAARPRIHPMLPLGYILDAVEALSDPPPLDLDTPSSSLPPE